MTSDLNMSVPMSQGYDLITDVGKLKGATGREDAAVDHHKHSPLNCVLAWLRDPPLKPGNLNT